MIQLNPRFSKLRDDFLLKSADYLLPREILALRMVATKLRFLVAAGPFCWSRSFHLIATRQFSQLTKECLPNLPLAWINSGKIVDRKETGMVNHKCVSLLIYSILEIEDPGLCCSVVQVLLQKGANASLYGIHKVFIANMPLFPLPLAKKRKNAESLVKLLSENVTKELERTKEALERARERKDRDTVSKLENFLQVCLRAGSSTNSVSRDLR